MPVAGAVVASHVVPLYLLNWVELAQGMEVLAVRLGTGGNVLEPVGPNGLLEDSTVVLAAAGGEAGLPPAVQQAVVRVLRAWVADDNAKVSGGALHYGVKSPRMGADLEAVKEIHSCGPLVGEYLRVLEQILLGLGALALLQRFSQAVNDELF